MDKIIIDCATGEKVEVPLTEEEIAYFANNADSHLGNEGQPE